MHDEAALIFGDGIAGMTDVRKSLISWRGIALILLEELMILGLVGWLKDSELGKNYLSLFF